ncbi:MAG: hypothetical protein R3331_04835 [Sulfurospirillaceae bacterium]|nr:hypothetical protein [Sulfurospirillaceae bacterium]
MKFFYMIIMICCFFGANMQAESYIYTNGKASLSLPSKGVTLYNGVPVQIISKQGNNVKIKIKGFVAKNDTTKLYATTNRSLLLASVKNKKNLIKVSKGEGILVINVPKNILTDDMDEAWETNSDLFYDKCTKCHHAKVIKNHTMMEWEAIFGSMKQKAKTSNKQNKLIIRFLKAFAKDGILTESN